ncbi:MAG TPA: hypothetical protein DEB39_08535 [Planctomycetaceae bacterium]|nr:hypothetical protein [Planctomycetaceae bacterium]
MFPLPLLKTPKIPVYTVNGMTILPRTIACRSNDPLTIRLYHCTNRSQGRVSAAGRFDQMFVFIAFPV